MSYYTYANTRDTYIIYIHICDQCEQTNKREKSQTVELR